MGLWGILLHLGNFALPALAVAALLSPGVLGRRGLLPLAAGWRRLWRTWAWLAGSGLAVLVAGLVGFGRDGRIATYAALVLVMGSLACWLQRRASRADAVARPGVPGSSRRPARGA